MVTALLHALLRDASTWLYTSAMILANAALGWIALEIARFVSRREREKVEGPNISAEAAPN